MRPWLKIMADTEVPFVSPSKFMLTLKYSK